MNKTIILLLICILFIASLVSYNLYFKDEDKENDGEDIDNFIEYKNITKLKLTERKLVEGDELRTTPVIHGDFVAWIQPTEFYSMAGDVYVTNIKTNETRMLTYKQDNINLEIYGDLIAWTERQTQTSVVIYYLENRTVRELAFPVAGIYGNNVLFIDDGRSINSAEKYEPDGNKTFYIYNVSTNEIEQVYKIKGYINNVQIQGDIILFGLEKEQYYYDLVTYNLKTEEERIINNGLVHKDSFDIDDDRIVYCEEVRIPVDPDGYKPENYLVLYNYRNETYRNYGEKYHVPYISQNYIFFSNATWEEPSSRNFTLIDLSEKKTYYSISNNHFSISHEFTSINKNKIVYADIDHDLEDVDIFLFEFGFESVTIIV